MNNEMKEEMKSRNFDSAVMIKNNEKQLKQKKEIIKVFKFYLWGTNLFLGKNFRNK